MITARAPAQVRINDSIMADGSSQEPSVPRMLVTTLNKNSEPGPECCASSGAGSHQ